MSLEPSFPQDHVPSHKLGNLEGQGFKVLVDSEFEGTGMCYLAFGVPSIDDNEGFWRCLQGERQVIFDSQV